MKAFILPTFIPFECPYTKNPPCPCITLHSLTICHNPPLLQSRNISIGKTKVWDGVPPITHDACGHGRDKTIPTIPTMSSLHCSHTGPRLLSHHHGHQCMHTTESQTMCHRASQGPPSACIPDADIFPVGVLHALD